MPRNPSDIKIVSDITSCSFSSPGSTLIHAYQSDVIGQCSFSNRCTLFNCPQNNVIQVLLAVSSHTSPCPYCFTCRWLLACVSIIWNMFVQSIQTSSVFRCSSCLFLSPLVVNVSVSVLILQTSGPVSVSQKDAC